MGGKAGAAAGLRSIELRYGHSIALFDGESPANDTRTVSELKWIHCSNEGEYLGHHQGEFRLTRETFESFIRNFRDDPQYKAGTLQIDGQPYTGGINPVLQFDYEHASEQASTEGTIPTSGAPAIGWVLELQIRNGPDGRAQLWALAKLGDQIRGQIQRNEYRSVSIAFALEGTHWITGADIGPHLTSIAFTNHPYMRDLTPVAARGRRTSQPQQGAVGSPGESSEAPGGGRGSTRTGANMDEKLRERICKALNIRTAATDEEVAAAADTAAGNGSKLAALVAALQAVDFDAALKAIPGLQAAREAAQAALTEIDALLSHQSQSDEALATADAGAAMSAQKLSGEGAKKAFLAYRGHLVSEEVNKVLAAHKNAPIPPLAKILAAREAGRKRFLTEYGVTETTHAQLTQTLVAGPGGAQVEPPKPMGIDTTGDGKTIDLRGVAGVNTTTRVIAHLRKTDPGFEKLGWEKQCSRAAEVMKTHQLQLE